MNDKSKGQPAPDSRAERFRAFWTRWSERIRRHVPPGARTLLGLVLIVGGMFGFLPVLGFWMIPLGLAVIAMDLRALAGLWRRWRNGGR